MRDDERTRDTWCWHCCHPFDGTVVRLPVHHDSRTETWTYKGQFCSWGCAKAYNFGAGRSYRSNINGQLLTLLKKRTTKQLCGIVPAPPRQCLRVFGGTMSIDEFRAISDSGIVIDILPTRMVPLELIVHQRRVDASKSKTILSPSDVISNDAVSMAKNNEMLRLKRPKHVRTTTDNSLVASMGLQIHHA